MPDVIAIDDFRAAAREGRTPAGIVQRLATGQPAQVRDTERAARFTFSDESVDRCGDKISQAGWQLSAFKQNPVALWAHDAKAPPIGKVHDVGVVNGKLMGTVEFVPAGNYPLADSIYQLIRLGFINTVSVGFLPIEWRFTTDPKRKGGVDFTKQELVEISVVPVPCNANALIAASEKGIDVSPLRTWARRTLDGTGIAKAGQRQARQRLLQEALRGDGPEAVEARRRYARAKAIQWRARLRFGL